MKLIVRSLGVLLLFVCIGCGHSINITPPLNTLEKKEIIKIDKNVGYYISAENMALEVTTPGGGGDSVKYFPYKEAEPALNKILSNIFNQVYRLKKMNDSITVKEKDIAYIFSPEYKTDSSSGSAFTWPPTKFSMTIVCTAVNADGETLWETKTTGVGEAEFSEFKHDFSLAARRAVKNAFLKLQGEIINSGKF